MSKPQIELKPKAKGPMNTLTKLNEEYDLTKQRSQKLSYKIPTEPPEHR